MNKNHIIRIKDILEVTQGTLIIGNENEECKEFTKDTREIKGNETYIGLVGEKINGGIYYEEAFKNVSASA